MSTMKLYRAKQKFSLWFSVNKNLFWFGCFLTGFSAFAQIYVNKHNNFKIFRLGCLDFWNGVNPYSDWHHPYDIYAYGPLFSVLFTPIALLPDVIGGFVWNILNYSLFFYALFKIPTPFLSDRQKRFAFLYLLPILITSLHFFQYNVTVASLLLLCFTLLETKKYSWAVVLLLISGFTKIYGLFQAVTVVMYPKFKRLFILGMAVSLLFFFLPLVNIPLGELVHYYKTWFEALGRRHDALNYNTIFRMLHRLGFSNVSEYVRHIQLSTLLVVGAMVLYKYKSFRNSAFRAKVLGVIVCWAILFSNATEPNTYIIALPCYLLWYFQSQRTRLDKIVLWTIFFILIISPMDVFCPVFINAFLFEDIVINLILFSLTWLYMCYDTFT